MLNLIELVERRVDVIRSALLRPTVESMTDANGTHDPGFLSMSISMSALNANENEKMLTGNQNSEAAVQPAPLNPEIDLGPNSPWSPGRD